MTIYELKDLGGFLTESNHCIVINFYRILFKLIFLHVEGLIIIYCMHRDFFSLVCKS